MLRRTAGFGHPRLPRQFRVDGTAQGRGGVRGIDGPWADSLATTTAVGTRAQSAHGPGGGWFRREGPAFRHRRVAAGAAGARGLERGPDNHLTPGNLDLPASRRSGRESASSRSTPPVAAASRRMPSRPGRVLVPRCQGALEYGTPSAEWNSWGDLARRTVRQGVVVGAGRLRCRSRGRSQWHQATSATNVARPGTDRHLPVALSVGYCGAVCAGRFAARPREESSA